MDKECFSKSYTKSFRQKRIFAFCLYKKTVFFEDTEMLLGFSHSSEVFKITLQNLPNILRMYKTNNLTAIF